MTRDVNPLTPHATAPAAASATIASGSIRPMHAALVRLGYDGGRLLSAMGVTADQLADPDAQLPCTCFGELLACAQRESPRPNLALDIATVTPIGAYPLIDYLVLSSGTVGEGLRRLERYFDLLATGTSMRIEEAEDLVHVQWAGTSVFASEFSVALGLLHLRRESEGRARAAVVHFVHRPADLEAFQKAIGCPIVAGSTWSGFSMTHETWAMPMRRGDPVLIGVLERHADDMLARQPVEQDLVARVRRAVALGLPRGQGDLEAVSRTFALTARTLQRRLAQEGTSFQRLLDEARSVAATRQLRESSLSIAEISFVLGYSEPAAFHRAFRRWHGVTPQEYRHDR
jgi:AraC-like DNA-binding protein